MDIQVENNAPTLTLHQAVLLYENASGSTAYASVHDVRFDEGKALLEAGTPVTLAGLRGALEEIIGAHPLEFLPPHVLASSRERLLWHVPEGRRALFFKTTATSATSLSGKVFPHPPLAFMLQSGGHAPSLSVFALRRRGRPRSDTLLYRAPFFNVSDTGSVCLGTMQQPQISGVAAAEAWTESFFASAFTHGTGRRLLRGQPGYVQTLEGLAHDEAARFPTARLVPTGKRLEDLITSQ